MSSTLRATAILVALLSATVPATAQVASAPSQFPPFQAPDSPPLFAVERAQVAGDASPAHTGIKDIVTDIFGDFRHLASMSNVGAGIIGTSGALAAHRIDDDVNRHLYGRGGVHDFFLPGKTIGQAPVQVGVGVLTYVIGRATDRPRATHIGMDLLRADAVAGVLTVALKETIRRERPDGSNQKSFPSGHASMTFATATVLARHFGWRVAAPTYLLAAYVAASRLHENRHFLSDVVAGSTLGYIAGRTVTRHGRSSFTMVPIMEPHGGGILFTRVW